MTNVTIQALARHFLTFIGGILITLGWVDATTFEQAAGAIATVAGVIWSWWDKVDRIESK